MKRALHIAMMTWYLVAATGVYLHLHYCGGVLSNIGLFGACAHSCCEDVESSPCCETEDIYLALEDEHRVFSVQVLPAWVADLSTPPTVHPNPDLIEPAPSASVGERAPPEPLYRLYGQHLTYG